MSVQGPEVTCSSGVDKDKETSVSDAVSLCGAVDFDAVKLLLSQWLQSCHSECHLVVSMSLVSKVRSQCHLVVSMSLVSNVRSLSVT